MQAARAGIGVAGGVKPGRHCGTLVAGFTAVGEVVGGTPALRTRHLPWHEAGVVCPGLWGCHGVFAVQVCRLYTRPSRARGSSAQSPAAGRRCGGVDEPDLGRRRDGSACRPALAKDSELASSRAPAKGRKTTNHPAPGSPSVVVAKRDGGGDSICPRVNHNLF